MLNSMNLISLTLLLGKLILIAVHLWFIHIINKLYYCLMLLTDCVTSMSFEFMILKLYS